MFVWLQNFVNTYVVPFVVDLAIAAVVLIVGLKLVSFLITRLKKRKFMAKLDSNIGTLLLNALKVVLNALIIIIAIQIMGVPSATIVAVIGSCGLAFGLALQGGLSNLAGGVMLMIFKPFHVGDYISTKDGDGTVEDIGIFYTRLVTVDNLSINIPNSVLSSNSVTNMSAKGMRGVEIEISVAYGTDIEKARKALLGCAEKEPLILKEPAASVFVTAHDDSCVKLMFRSYTESGNFVQMKAKLLEESLKALHEAGVEIPFPQMDVHMK